MPPAPKPTKQPKGKKRQRVLVRYDCGCWEMTFRSAMGVCKTHNEYPVVPSKVYGLGLKYITEHAALVDILDDLASLIVRRRDGYQCVLPNCQSRTAIDCGHVFVRAKWAVRWDFDNLNALCRTCNYKDALPAYSHIYKDWYRAKFGEEQYQTLKARAEVHKEGKDWTIPELRDLVLKFEDMLDALEHMSLLDYETLRRRGYFGDFA